MELPAIEVTISIDFAAVVADRHRVRVRSVDPSSPLSVLDPPARNGSILSICWFVLIDFLDPLDLLLREKLILSFQVPPLFQVSFRC